MPQFEPVRDELAHAHTCPHCQDQRFCTVMFCRDQVLKACWSCRQRSLE